MTGPLLANRFARDREGRCFDLASGRDVSVEYGVPAAGWDAGLVDHGVLDDRTPFVASVEGLPVWNETTTVTADRWARLAADAIDGADDRLRELRLRDDDEGVGHAAWLATAREARLAGCVPVSLAGLRRLPCPGILVGRSVVVVEARAGSGDASTAVLALSAIRSHIRLVVWRGDVAAVGAARQDHHGLHLSAWGRTARGDRRLQSLRGELRRRQDVGSYLATTRLLATGRYARGELPAARRVAREARTWTAWWRGGAGSTPADWLDTVAGLQELEQRVLLERGRLDEVRVDLETVLWFARVRGHDDLAAATRASLARAWRLGGALVAARQALGDAWPVGATRDTQIAWGREALRVAMLVRDRGVAGAIAARLRASVAIADPAVTRVVTEEIALLHSVFGDRRARDELLRAATDRRGARLAGLERARSRMLQAALRPSRAPAHTSCHLTTAMRSEQRQMRQVLDEAAAWSDLDPGRAPPLRLPFDAPPLAGDEGVMRTVLQVLAACHAEDDEAVALQRVCRFLREPLDAVAVGIWTAHSPQPMASAGQGRAWPSAIAARARVTGEPIGPEGDETGQQAAWPVRFGATTVGALACAWLPDTRMSRPSVTTILTAASAACAPLVRAWLDRASTPVVIDAFGIIGQSLAMHELRSGIQRAANVPYHVLVEGESGSGKELVARAIHQASARRQKKFRAVNCAALTDDLLEAELFGHTKGAFTGALMERAGLFEEACGGTLLLDEIADLSPRAQAKVLRVLQDGEIRRVGESFSRRVDVRIVAATNKPLRHEAAAGRFREDLRYRLDVLRLTIPPLRDRRDDVPLLAGHFWREAAGRVGSTAVLDQAVVAALARYDWPGNVRELQNVIAALAVHAPLRGRVTVSALPRHVQRPVAVQSELPLDEARRRFELEFVRGALVRSGGRRSEAARVLGVSRQGLAKLLTRLGLGEAS